MGSSPDASLDTRTPPDQVRPDLSFAEFVATLAALMALPAFGNDAMLPVLPDIGRAFAVTDASRLQWVARIFVMGAGAGRLIYSPLSDRFGRRPVLLAGLSL